MFDVTIIGCGRVGLPLALSLESAGLNVNGIDKDLKLINSVNMKKMPFDEPGYEKLLKDSNLVITHETSTIKYPETKAFIITVGTPLGQHIETDLSQVKRAIENVIQKAVTLKDVIIILRSTVAPGTSEFVVNLIENKTGLTNGKDFFFAMCPERLAEGVALEELKNLPQIIGTFDNLSSFERAVNIFKHLDIELISCTPAEAELAKLFSNIYRYISFSIPNYFMYVSHYFGVDIHNLLKIMKYKYPRNDGLKSPGFSAGTCLRKDFGMINECFPQTDLILQAYKINEFMPKFLVDKVEKFITNENIGILGYTMKADTDDTRDSLVPKLIRYIERKQPKNIFINEPNFKESTVNDVHNEYRFINYDLSDIMEICHVIFIATNHKEYRGLKFPPNIFVIDIWNVTGENQLMRYTK